MEHNLASYEETVQKSIRDALRHRGGLLDSSEAERVAADLLSLEGAERRDALRARGDHFARPEVCRALLARGRSQRHHDSEAMLDLARVAVEVADAFAASADGGELAPLASDLRAECLAAVANAQRVQGDFQAAADVWPRVTEALEAGSGDLLVRARCSSLQGEFWTDRRRFTEAIRLFKEAHRLYTRLRDSHRAGLVLNNLGRVYYELDQLDTAIRCAYAAARQVDGKRAALSRLVAVHNLAAYLNEAGHSWEALELLQRLRPLYRLEGRTLLAVRAQWFEGRLCLSLGRDQRAIDVLEAARQEFIRRQMAYDAAQVSLDLATAYARLGLTDEVITLAEEMVPIFVSRAIDSEAQAALLLFVRAAEAKRASTELLGSVVKLVERARAGSR